MKFIFTALLAVVSQCYLCPPGVGRSFSQPQRYFNIKIILFNNMKIIIKLLVSKKENNTIQSDRS